MLQSNTPTRKILESYPRTPYVLFKDKLYDIGNLMHPGGNYLLEELRGEEVSRYIYGAYSYELAQCEPHRHTVYAHKMLSERFVGDVDLSGIQLLAPKIGDHVNVPAVWTLRKARAMGSGVKCFLFESARYAVTAKPNIGYLGRHFLMSRPGVDMAPRLYTLALCMSDSHSRFVNSIVAGLKGEKSIN